ncbi:MAG: hypothetical protein K6T75_07750 [Acetobacteraceae bacterium]|nr:hypothetical protein [Acetobacteraceae bacterium]
MKAGKRLVALFLTVAVGPGGAVWAARRNHRGQLGDGTTTVHTSVQVQGLRLQDQ